MAVIRSDQVVGVYRICQFPRTVTVRVSFPFDPILQDLSTAVMAVIGDGFDFEFFFSAYEFRGRSQEVGSMRRSFSVRGQQRGMEDIVNVPGEREL